MDELTKFLLDKIGVYGAFIVGLAAYLVKKELAFQKERAEFLLKLEEKSQSIVTILEKSLTASHALEKEVYALRMQLNIKELPGDG